MENNSLVRVDDDGSIFIGALTKEQYLVIRDSLEFASVWVDRANNLTIAKALRNLIPSFEEMDEDTATNVSTHIYNNLPNSHEIDQLPAKGDAND